MTRFLRTTFCRQLPKHLLCTLVAGILQYLGNNYLSFVISYTGCPITHGIIKTRWHSDYRTVSHYWVLLVYVALIRAVWADDGDRPLLL
jgi:hypothetical protein